MKLLACLGCTVALAFVASGCIDSKTPEARRSPIDVPGIARPDQAPLESAPPTAQATPTPPPGALASPPGAPPTPAAPGNPPAAAPDKAGIIGKMTAKVVDKKTAMASNPDLVEVPNSLQGGDPISLAASAYFTIRSKASTLGFQDALTKFKGFEGRNPTYEEFSGMMKEHRIEFAMLPPYQTYGYDAQAGTIVVLEDKADKAKRYKEAGIPLE